MRAVAATLAQMGGSVVVRSLESVRTGMCGGRRRKGPVSGGEIKKRSGNWEKKKEEPSYPRIMENKGRSRGQCRVQGLGSERV